MRAGKLDRKIVIQSRTLTQNGTGESEESWSTFDTVWATKSDIRGSEGPEGAREQANGDTEFIIRWRSGLKNEMRVSYNSVIYDIVNIREIGRRQGLVLVTRAKVE